MPTAVSVARQCLTADAAQALDEAVAVAQRRGHAQTTSLHVVFALLSLPSSALRDACTRARGGSTYSPRLQLKALELCLSVSLDRVPSGQLTEDPPVSNSLMAAIKRSQANQRRQPENFHLYHQLSNQSSSINNVIKVELQHLILSILDDPVVSRVFGEAGFRSPEIKIAIVRPLPQLLRYSSRPRGPPMFLCNLNQDLSPGFIKFPFSVFPGISDLDDNHRQIGEILGRSKGRNNPLLIGATASSILKGFIQTLSLRGGGEWLFGFRVIDMESCGHDKLEEEVGKMVKSTLQEGWENTNMVVVVNMGDLTSLSEDDGAEGVVVTRLTTLLGNQEVKMRLMGWVESYDTYLKYVNKYPSVEKDWELQLLPIPTLSAAASMPELLSYPRSRLMESFVPLGGFFTSSTDLNGHLPCSSLSHKSDAALLPKEATSIADRCQYSLPPWMQMAELGTDAAQAKDDTLAVTTQLEKESLHQNQPPPIREHDIQSRVGILPTSDSSKKSADKEADASRCRTSDNSCGMESPKIAISISSQVVSEAHHLPEQQPRKQSFFLSNNVNSISAGGVLGSSICCRSNDECLQTSPASVTSATSNVGLFGPSNLNSKQSGQFCEKIYGALIEKVGRQYEAVREVSKTVAYSRMKSQNRGDLWLSFLGPDRIGKRKVAVSLSEVLYGSRENLIDVDLCSSFELESSYRGKTVVDVIAAELSKKPMAVVFLDNIDKADEQIQSCLFQAIWTGKLSDSFGREVRVNRAIFVITSSFTTPNEEEITAGEAVKAVTAKYSEDTVLAAAARKLPLKILVEEDTIRMKPQMNKRKLVVSNEGRGGKEEEEVKKRAYKTTPTIRTLDLNLPAEIEQLPENQNDAIIMMPESSKAWLLDFFDRTDASIIFRPYDFDSLAEKILKDLRLRLHQTVKKECSIEIDTQVMEQLLSAVYTSDSYKVVDDWITQVETHYITNTKLTTPATVRLTVCEDEVFSEEQSSCGNLLPCLS